MDNNKITKNSFSGGRNSDVNVAILPPDQYIEAHNVDFIANGNFYALQNLSGTTFLSSFGTDATLREIGSYPCKFTINGTLTYCIIYATMSSNTGTFNLWAYDTQNIVLYALYQETYGVGYYTTDRVVDFVNYPENGVDHVYFADGYNELRQLTCTITTPWIPNSLSAYDLALLRRGANGTIALSSIANGGSLLSGTYQFSYRMCNPTAKKFTKWSSISNPINVYDSDNTDAQVFAGIGLPTTRKIIVTVTPSAQEIAALTSLPYIQLAVIENIGSTPAISVSLQQFTSFIGTSMNLTYQSNARVDSTPLDSFLIDSAQIESAKTLRTTNNRLFLGNVKYANLQFNSSFGAPAISAGTIASKTSTDIGSSQGDSFSSDTFSSKYIGYFRDEVYRFGVVYKDKYGNKSYVSPLDLSAVVDNQITGGVKDMHFPARSFNKKYTLFKSNGQIQSLGLNLSLINHPTWAVELEVVRVPRKKDIQFQSPVIPMMTVNGIGTLGDYPSKFSTATGSTTFNSASNTTSVQPMTAGKVMVPKNMFWPEGRDISRYSADIGSPGIQHGEVHLDNFPGTCTYAFSMLFPTANMYGDTTPVNGLTNGFVYTGSEKIDFIDRALLKLNYVSLGSSGKSPYIIGEDINTNTTGNFYAVLDGDYYFDSGWAAKTKPNSSYSGAAMTGYQFYDNFGQTAPVSGIAVMDYQSLSTNGFKFGYQPNIQRSGVASFGFAIPPEDPTKLGAVFANGTLNAIGGGGGFIVGGSGSRYQTPANIDNSYLNEPSTYGYISDTGYCTAVDIVNIKLGLSDNRYGDINSLQLYQSTGAIYTFTSTDQTTLQSGGQITVTLDVFGGDCFVSAHTFKICDSTYSVTNSAKGKLPGSTNSNTIETQRWGGYYVNSTYGNIISLPVAVENSSQFITVVLESEYNGGVRDHDIIVKQTASNGFPILNNPTVNTCRVPLSYRYNFNISRSNYQKVFTTALQFSFQQYNFAARVPWSNIKIYNSDQSGFDVFNVSDFMDLPEQRYDITSLAVAGDMLYALQEKGVVYLPTSSRQIEQSDSNTLAVTSGDVIGRPIVVSTERGTQHLRSVAETGEMIFTTDNKNKEVYGLVGTELRLITENQQTVMKNIWSSQFAGNAVKGVYDFVNEQYLVIMPTTIQFYHQPRGLWVGDWECSPFGGTYQRGVVYMTAFNSNTLGIYSIHTGAPNQLFGNTVDPRVVFAVNPDEAFAKTFDVFMIDSSDKLSTADLQVVYDSTSSTSTITGLNLAVPNIENNYRIPLGKDQNGYRLRGMRMLVTAHFGALTAQLKAIYTKYRYSKRVPF